MANPAATSVFVPSTVVSVERSTTQHVSRFASPLRALGARTLGFVDRLLGAHLWQLTGGDAASGRSARIFGGSLPMPVPWYELPPRVGADRRPSPALPARVQQVAPVAHAASPASVASEVVRQVAESFPGAIPGRDEAPANSASTTSAPVSAIVLPSAEPTFADTPTLARASVTPAPVDAPLPMPIVAPGVAPVAPATRVATAPISVDTKSASSTTIARAPLPASASSPASSAATMPTVLDASATHERTANGDLARPDTNAPIDFGSTSNPVLQADSPSVDTSSTSLAVPQRTVAADAPFATLPSTTTTTDRRAIDVVVSLGRHAAPAPVITLPAALTAAPYPMSEQSATQGFARALARPLAATAWVDSWLTRLAGLAAPATLPTGQSPGSRDVVAPARAFVIPPATSSEDGRGGGQNVSVPTVRAISHAASEISAQPLQRATQVPERVVLAPPDVTSLAAVSGVPATAGRTLTPPFPTASVQSALASLPTGVTASTEPLASTSVSDQAVTPALIAASPTVTETTPATPNQSLTTTSTSSTATEQMASSPDAMPAASRVLPMMPSEARNGVTVASPAGLSTPSVPAGSVRHAEVPSAAFRSAPASSPAPTVGSSASGFVATTNRGEATRFAPASTEGMFAASLAALSPQFGASLADAGVAIGAAAAPGTEGRSFSIASIFSTAHAGVVRFVERLVGIRSARDARVLPISGGSLELVGPDVRPSRAFATSDATTSNAARLTAPSAATRVSAPMSVVAPSGEFIRETAPDALSSATARAAATTAARTVDTSPMARAATAETNAPQATSSPMGNAGVWSIPSPASIGTGPSTSPSAPETPWLRPGRIAARAELAAAQIGLRAAGMSLDFVDPQQVPSLTEARVALERTLLALPTGNGRGTDARPTATSMASSSVRPGTATPQLDPARATVPAGTPFEAVASSTAHTPGVPPRADAGGATSFAPVHATSAPAWSVPASPSENPLADVSASDGVALPAVRAARQVLARQARDVWALASLFPTATPSLLASFEWEQVFPTIAALGGSPSGSASVVRGGATAAPMTVTGLPAAASDLARPSVSQTTTVSGASMPVRERFVPEVPRTLVTAVPPTEARATLPDGRVPRGSFTWSRAATFVSQLGEWMVPVNAVAASAGAEAAAEGRSVWGGMPQIASPVVVDPVLGDVAAPASSDGARSAPALQLLQGGTSPSSPSGVASRLPGGLPLPTVAGTRDGRTGTSWSFVAPAAGGRDARVGAPSSFSAGGDDRSPASTVAFPSSDAVAPLLRALVAGAAPPSSAGDSSRSWTPPDVSGSQPVVTAAPASEASARMVEALRTQQQHGASDDRVTLADLTLVAVASATQQMAASASSPSGSARPSGGHGGGESRQEERRDPEAERVYIDEMAREVIEEVRQQFRLAHERSGRNWET